MTIQMKATEHYFPVVLFIMLYRVVLTFESADEILKCDHSILHLPGTLVSSPMVLVASSVVYRLVMLLRNPLLDGSVVDVLVAFPSSSKSYGVRSGAISPGW